MLGQEMGRAMRALGHKPSEEEVSHSYEQLLKHARTTMALAEPSRFTFIPSAFIASTIRA